jgi:hypothetical protein
MCFLLPAAIASAADYTFSGFAHDRDSGELLYVETHSVCASDTLDEQRVVLYRRDEHAAPFARKTLSYRSDRQRPSFDFSDLRSGVAESVTRESRGFWVTTRTGAQAKPRSTLIADSDVAVIDAGFDEFVRAYWAELQRGESLDAQFLVPSRLDAVQFRVRKVDQARIAGDEASVIRLALAGPLGWFLPDIEVSYRNRDGRLLRYRGLTNIRDAAGKLLEAQIDFPDSARVAGEVDLEQLRELPLAASR